MKQQTLLATLAISLLFVGAGCAPKTANTDAQNGAAIGPSGEGPGVPAPVAPAPAAGGAAVTPRSSTITLKATGSSGQSGTAVLTDIAGNNTRIDITLTGKDTDKSQTAAIFAGTCATQSAQVQYPLSPVVNGKSTTTLNVNIGALIDKVPQAIKIKQDAVDANAPYAACGELR